MSDFEQWNGFSGVKWKDGIDVRDFIQDNYTPYDGDESFLKKKDLPREPTDFGKKLRNCRDRRGQRAVCLIWTLLLYPD